VTTLSIGQVAETSGVKIPTIRYYEQIGLLPEPPRTASNRRCYDAEAAQQLRFIRHARELGFEVDAIRTLIEMQHHPMRSCEQADAIATAQLAAIDSRIARLTALKEELERMADCDRHGRVRDCRVIEILADHDQCLHDAH